MLIPDSPRCPYCTEDHLGQLEPISKTAHWLCDTCGKTFVLVSDRDYRRLIDPDVKPDY